MGSKKKRNRRAGVTRSLEGNRAIAASTGENSRGVETAENPHRPKSANSSGENALVTGRDRSNSKGEEVRNDEDDVLDDAVPATFEEWQAVVPVLLRKATTWLRSHSEHDDPEAYEVVACLREQVTIAYNLLAEQPSGGLEPMKRVLERLAIETKLSARTEAAAAAQAPAPAGKSWAQVAASVPAKYVPRAYTLDVTVHGGDWPGR